MDDDFDLNPYRVLDVPRDASQDEIKRAYRGLSKKYHYDSAMNRDILPGSCNNLEDVRERWEDIKRSYEILSDRKRRLRWNRKNFADDPGAAAGRAVMNYLGAGIGVGARGVMATTGFLLDRIAESTKVTTESVDGNQMESNATDVGTSTQTTKKEDVEDIKSAAGVGFDNRGRRDENKRQNT